MNLLSIPLCQQGSISPRLYAQMLSEWKTARYQIRPLWLHHVLTNGGDPREEDWTSRKRVLDGFHYVLIIILTIVIVIVIVVIIISIFFVIIIPLSSSLSASLTSSPSSSSFLSSFHIAVCLFNNRSWMTSKCSKDKKERHTRRSQELNWCSWHTSTSSLFCNWTNPQQHVLFCSKTKYWSWSRHQCVCLPIIH